jgi:hypothetical protein
VNFPPWRRRSGGGGGRLCAATLRAAATWRSGYAAACKAVYTGSIPVVAYRSACNKRFCSKQSGQVASPNRCKFAAALRFPGASLSGGCLLVEGVWVELSVFGQREAAAQVLREALAATDLQRPEGQEVLAQYLTAHRFNVSLWLEAQALLAPMLEAARQGRTPDHPGVGAHVVLELALSGAPATVVRSLAEQVSSAPAAVDPAALGMVMGMLVQALCMIDELDAAARIAGLALGAA